MKKLIFTMILIITSISYGQWDNSVSNLSWLTVTDTCSFGDSLTSSNIIDTKGLNIGSFNFSDSLDGDTITVWHSNNQVTWTTLYDLDGIAIWSCILSSPATKDYVLFPSNSFIQKRYVKVIKSGINVTRQTFNYSRTKYLFK